MIEPNNVAAFLLYNSMNYKKLDSDKEGLSSVRENDQYRIDFEDIVNGIDNQRGCNVTKCYYFVGKREIS